MGNIESTQIYDPQIVPYPKKAIVDELVTFDRFDWSRFVSGDIMVDLNGVPHFFEINGIPNLLFEYCQLYDENILLRLEDLFPSDEAIGAIFKQQRDAPELLSDKYHRENVLILEYFKKLGRNIHFLAEDELKLGDGGFYAGKALAGTTKEEIELDKAFHFRWLLNRCLGSANLFRRIPKERRMERHINPEQEGLVGIMTPIAYGTLAINKDKCIAALRDYIEMPETYMVNNWEELEVAVETIETHIQSKHPNYRKPWVVLKNPKGTGGYGMMFVADKESLISGRIIVLKEDGNTEQLPKKKINFPYLVQERISSALYNDREVDLRFFFTGGGSKYQPWSSHPIARAASGINEFHKYATSLSQGGDAIRMSYEASAILQDYVLAICIGIEKKLRGNIDVKK
ncbi:MAG: hypothetical protein ABIG89_01650 [Candidatus Woesearchaeota archaeon]